MTGNIAAGLFNTLRLPAGLKSRWLNCHETENRTLLPCRNRDNTRQYLVLTRNG